MRLFLTRGCWVAGVVLALGSWTGDAHADDLIKDVARRNRAAVEAIHTLSCQYSKARYDESGKLVEQYGEVKYWRSGPNWRSKWTHKGEWVDAVCDDQQIRTRSSGPKLPSVGGLVAVWSGLPGPHGDPWLDTLVTSIGDPAKGPKPLLFEDQMTYPGKRSARREEVGGVSFVVVANNSEDGYYSSELWFDPRANYLKSRSVTTAKPGSPRWPAGRSEVGSRTEVTRFAEPAPGVFFPAEVTKVQTMGGKFQYREVGQVTNIRINAPLPPDIFSLNHVPGDRVNDHLQGKTYTISPDGKSQTNVRPVAPLTPPVGAPEVAELTETKAEPRSVTVWLLPLSAGLIGVGGILLYIRRRRANRR